MAGTQAAETIGDAPVAALATLVKTPALSPVKTRLAAEVGAARALAVYEESLRLLRVQLRAAAAGGVRVHWAVAEESAAGAECWADFPAFWTGEGDFGTRLHQVYAHLRRIAPRAIIIGADSPQLRAELIVHAAQEDGTVIGPAQDGGFYLFASSEEFTLTQWQHPEYSTDHTLAMLQEVLPHAPALLPPLTDIDDTASLRACISEFANPAEATALTRLLV